MKFSTTAIITFTIFIVVIIAIPTALPAVIIGVLLAEWILNLKTDRTLTGQAYDAFQVSQFRLSKKEYLQSDEWERKRLIRYREADGLCECCGKPLSIGNFEVHHIRGYTLIPNEPLDAIRVLHPDCHQLQHEIYGYPETLEDYKKWDIDLYKLPKKDI